MINQEAIETIKIAIAEVEWNYPMDYSIAFDMAITALEKQIPKKPRKYIAFDGIERNGCPACLKDEILYAGQKYCSVCGKKIDWSREK